ncbi:hypothetical protein GX586_16100 [bacterium]|nr:hypothetical protein [bacterium]
MKRTFLLVGIVCLVAGSLYSAEFVAQPSYVNTNWNTPALWDAGDFPKALGDVAIITNVYIGNTTGARSIGLNIAATVSALRVLGATPSNTYVQISDNYTGNRLYMQSSSGNAQIEGGGYTIHSWGSELSVPLVLVSDTDLRVTTNKIFMLGKSLYGTADLHLYIPRGGGLLAMRVDASPGYSGTVYAEQSAGERILVETQVYMLTNATIVIRTGATLLVATVARLGAEMRMEPGSRMESYYGRNTSNEAPLVILGGTVTNGTRDNAFMVFRGDVSGTGVLVKVNTGTTGTNYFTGSISPGLSAGTLTMDEKQGTTRIGMPGAPVTLNIEDKDQLELLSMDEAVDLANVRVRFLTSTEQGTTNWFLTCTSNVVNTLNGIEYAPGLTGSVFYEADRVGAVVVPEPAALMLGALAVFAAIKRR